MRKIKNKINNTAKKNKSEIAENYNIYRGLLIILIGSISFIFDKIAIKIINVIQYPILFKFFYSITLLGELYIFMFIIAIIASALMIYRKPVTTLVVTTVSAGVISWLLKFIINRPRPFEAANINSVIITMDSSFPSGHTLLFFSIVPIMIRSFPKIKILVGTIAVLVGFSRMYLGVHYFSDVVSGAIIGYGIGWAVLKLGEKYAWKY